MRQQIQVIPVPASGQQFKAQLSRTATFLTITATPEGPLLHLLSGVDDILVEREFAMIPSGAQFEAPLGKELKYQASLNLNPAALHFFELVPKAVLIGV